MQSRNKALGWMIAIVVIGMAGSAWGLSALLGPTDNGMRCERTPTGSSCRVFRTTFLGLLGNSSFDVPESSISRAVAECARRGVGGHHGAACAAYLQVEPTGRQLVSSYALEPQAAAAVTRINDYLADHSVRSLEINDSMLTPMLLYGVLPVLLGLVVFGAATWLRRMRSPDSVSMLSDR